MLMWATGIPETWPYLIPDMPTGRMDTPEKRVDGSRTRGNAMIWGRTRERLVRRTLVGRRRSISLKAVLWAITAHRAV